MRTPAPTAAPASSISWIWRWPSLRRTTSLLSLRMCCPGVHEVRQAQGGLRGAVPPHFVPRVHGRYGSDKPDLRIDLELTDAACLQDCGLSRCRADRQGRRRAGLPQDPQFIDKLCAEAEMFLRRQGLLVPSGRKRRAGRRHLQVCRREEGRGHREKLGLTKNSFVALAAGKYGAAVKTAGELRKLLGAQVEGHMDADAMSSAGSSISRCMRSARSPASWSSVYPFLHAAGRSGGA